jgi:hypothetical protein
VELEGKLTKAIAELGRATREGCNGGRLPYPKVTGGGDPWWSSSRGKGQNGALSP